MRRRLLESGIPLRAFAAEGMDTPNRVAAVAAVNMTAAAGNKLAEDSPHSHSRNHTRSPAARTHKMAVAAGHNHMGLRLG